TAPLLDRPGPVGRDGSPAVLLEEVPELQRLLAVPPGEVGPAVVHGGREADLAAQPVHEHHAELVQLGQRAEEVALGGRDLFPELVTAGPPWARPGGGPPGARGPLSLP